MHKMFSDKKRTVERRIITLKGFYVYSHFMNSFS